MDRTKREKSYHSRAYHRYFEGYAEKEVIDSNGKKRIERTYIGPFYRIDVSDASLKLIKALYVVLFLISVAIFVISGTAKVDSNLSIYMVLPITASILALARLAYLLFFKLTAKREMEIRSWRESSRGLITIGFIASGCLFLSAVVTFVLIILVNKQDSSKSIMVAVGYIVSAICAFVIGFVESKLPFKKLPSREKLKGASYPIKLYTDL